MSKKITEFSLIKNFFTQLAQGNKGALNLQDDCGYIKGVNGNDYVITLDTICEGVHFPYDFAPEFVANRLIIPNLSDLASSGAKPLYFLMTGNITKKQNAEWYKKFTNQIAKLQKQYGFKLLGGDTVKTKNDDIFLSATFIGEVKSGKQLTRLGAKAGDDIYVSGEIGGGWLGLRDIFSPACGGGLRRGCQELDDIIHPPLTPPASRGRTKEHNSYVKYYTNPTPQLKLGEALVGITNSCTDISDGLVKDLGNICCASNLSAVIYKEKIPLVLNSLSRKRDELNDKIVQGVRAENGAINHLDSGFRWNDENELFINQITGGDDYQLIFTAKKRDAEKINKIGKKLKIKLTRIGEMVKGKKDDVKILDKNLKEIKLDYQGWEH